MTKPGLKKLRCKVCGTEREIEAGIRTMFCCAQEMEEVTDEEVEQPAPRLKKFKVGD